MPEVAKNIHIHNIDRRRISIIFRLVLLLWRAMKLSTRSKSQVETRPAPRTTVQFVRNLFSSPILLFWLAKHVNPLVPVQTMTSFWNGFCPPATLLVGGANSNMAITFEGWSAFICKDTDFEFWGASKLHFTLNIACLLACHSKVFVDIKEVATKIETFRISVSCPWLPMLRLHVLRES